MLNAPHPATPTAPRTLLLTGFDPFGTDTVNPSWLIAQALHGQQIAGHWVVAAQLGTVFNQALVQLRGLVEHHQPALVLCLGQAGGRSGLSIERVGINVDDARIPDNQGAQPVDTPVVPGGPAAYFATVPIKAMLRAVQRVQVPCEVSQSAGTFVCNHVLYGLLHLLAHTTQPEKQAQRGAVRGGFVHVPWLPTQGTPHLPLSDMVRGVHAALWAAMLARDDIAWGAGATH